MIARQNRILGARLLVRLRPVTAALVFALLLAGCGPAQQQRAAPRGAPTWEGYVNNTPIPTPGVTSASSATTPAGTPGEAPGFASGEKGGSRRPTVAAPPDILRTVPATPTPTQIATPVPTPAAQVPAAGALAGRTIVLDPGHNGGASAAFNNRRVPAGNGRMKACNTSGTATTGGVPEHTINWRLAQALATRLRDAGATVVLTRPRDDGAGPCVDERAALGNRAGADAVLSLHADGEARAGARGFHVIRSTTMIGGAGVQAKSAALADAVVAAFETTGMPRSNYLGGGTAITPRDDIAGLNLSRVPAVMLEAGNLRNATDAARLTDPAFVQTQAAALLRALAAWFAR